MFCNVRITPCLASGMCTGQESVMRTATEVWYGCQVVVWGRCVRLCPHGNVSARGEPSAVPGARALPQIIYVFVEFAAH